MWYVRYHDMIGRLKLQRVLLLPCMVLSDRQSETLLKRDWLPKLDIDREKF